MTVTPDSISVVEIPVATNVFDISTTQLNTVELGPIGPQGPQGDPGEGVPVGGTAGQVLAKVSSTNYDTHWIDNDVGSVTSVDVSGGTTGLTTSGGPITSAGTITIGNLKWDILKDVLKLVLNIPYVVIAYDIYPQILAKMGILQQESVIYKFWKWLNKKVYNNE